MSTAFYVISFFSLALNILWVGLSIYERLRLSPALQKFCDRYPRIRYLLDLYDEYIRSVEVNPDHAFSNALFEAKERRKRLGIKP
jgi:uncharacterized membrane protein (UPF0127 family)